MAKRTLMPFALSMRTMSEIAYWAFATAIPYPTTCVHKSLSVFLTRHVQSLKTHQDNTVGIRKSINSLVHRRLRDLSFDLVVRLSRGRDTSEQDIR